MPIYNPLEGKTDSEINSLISAYIGSSNIAFQSDITAIDNDISIITNDINSIIVTLQSKSNLNHTHTGYSLINHTHDNFSEIDHTHDDYSMSNHSHDFSGDFADLNHIHDDYALSGHSHNEYSLELHTHDDYALLNHSHDYALPIHSHGQYAEIDHSHDYASQGHTHTQYSQTNHSHPYAPISHSHLTNQVSDIDSWFDSKVARNQTYSRDRIAIRKDNNWRWLLNTDASVHMMRFTSGYLEFYHGNTAYGVTVWASDINLKTNINYSPNIDCLAQINQIPLCSFDWVESNQHQDLGLIAQDLQGINPEWVINLSDGSLGVNEGRLATYLIGCIQKLSSKIEQLENIVNGIN